MGERKFPISMKLLQILMIKEQLVHFPFSYSICESIAERCARRKLD